MGTDAAWVQAARAATGEKQRLEEQKSLSSPHLLGLYRHEYAHVAHKTQKRLQHSHRPADVWVKRPGNFPLCAVLVASPFFSFFAACYITGITAYASRHFRVPLCLRFKRPKQCCQKRWHVHQHTPEAQAEQSLSTTHVPLTPPPAPLSAERTAERRAFPRIHSPAAHAAANFPLTERKLRS
jgi:hypothetical protein